jgi:hypothetical protein
MARCDSDEPSFARANSFVRRAYSPNRRQVPDDLRFCPEDGTTAKLSSLFPCVNPSARKLTEGAEARPAQSVTFRPADGRLPPAGDRRSDVTNRQGPESALEFSFASDVLAAFTFACAPEGLFVAETTKTSRAWGPRKSFLFLAFRE